MKSQLPDSDPQQNDIPTPMPRTGPVDVQVAVTELRAAVADGDIEKAKRLYAVLQREASRAKRESELALARYRFLVDVTPADAGTPVH